MNQSSNEIQTIIAGQLALIETAEKELAWTGRFYRKYCVPDKYGHSTKMHRADCQALRDQIQAGRAALAIIEHAATITKPGALGDCEKCEQWRNLVHVAGAGWLCEACDLDRVIAANPEAEGGRV